MIFCDIRSVRKLISSQQRKGSSFLEHSQLMGALLQQLQEKQWEAASHSNEVDSSTSVFESIFYSTTSLCFFYVFSGLQFRYIRVQCNLTRRLELSAWA